MKKPHLPTRLTILGQKWTVRYVPTVIVAGEAVSGLSDSATRTIDISTTENKTPEKMHSTLLHETIHSIFAVAGIQDLLDEKLEEAVVVSLENGLESLVTLKAFK